MTFYADFTRQTGEKLNVPQGHAIPGTDTGGGTINEFFSMTPSLMQHLQTAGMSSGFSVQRGELVTASMAGDIYKWYVTRWGAVGRSMPQHTRVSGPFLSQNEALSEKARIESGKPPTKPLATADPATNILIGKVLAQQQKPETELVAAPSGTVVATVQPAPAAPKKKTGTAVALGAAALAAYFFLK